MGIFFLFWHFLHIFVQYAETTELNYKTWNARADLSAKRVCYEEREICLCH